jgi:single-strand DNA-binding protein
MKLELDIIGNLGNDCVVQEVNGKKVVNFSIAHSEKWKGSDGVQKEKTTWVECNFWDADKLAPYLVKGTMVSVQGNPEVRFYQKNTGDNAAQLRCKVTRLQLLSSNKKNTEETKDLS